MNHDYLVSKELLASKEKRFLNYIIDYAVQFGLSFGFGVMLVIFSEIFNTYYMYDYFIENGSRLSDYILGAIILLIYYTLIETLTSRSIGKYVTNTKVITAEGNSPKFQDALFRTLCRLIPFEQFSFLGILGRGWHDSLTNTYVVDIKKYDAVQTSETAIELIGKPLED